MKIGEWLRSVLFFWKWERRRACHGSIRCCQYIDRPNDNQPGR